MNVLDSRGVTLVVGVGKVFIFIVWRGIPAQASEGVGGPRGEALVAGAIKVVVIGDSEFQDDLRFVLGSRLFIARRYDQNMVYQQYPCDLLDNRSVVIGRSVVIQRSVVSGRSVVIG